MGDKLTGDQVRLAALVALHERRVHLDKEAVAMEVNRVTLKNLWYLAK